MKFPTLKSVTIAVSFCFAFYSIVGCSAPVRTTKYLDAYDSLPYKDTIIVHAQARVAYNAAIVSLQKRGYVLTYNDPAAGSANFEMNSPTKLPEEQKQSEVDNAGPSVGTVILVVLAIILIVGIIYLIANSSDDDSQDHKKDSSKNDTKNSQNRGGRDSRNQFHHNERYHEHHDYIGPFISPMVSQVLSAPPPNPSYLYVLSLDATATSDSTTEIQLKTERLDLQGNEIMNEVQFENKYLNYSIFDGIGKEMQRK